MNSEQAIKSFDDLLAPYFASMREPSQQLLGTESEKFGILRDSGSPVSYDGRICGVLQILQALCDKHGWQPMSEHSAGPLIAIGRKLSSGATVSVTLEPGAQLELSGAPLATVHEVAEELRSHLDEVEQVSADCNIRWLGIGYHPFARQEQLPWVPKARYRIMREYFPTVGTRGLDMMRRTATTQVNLDYHSEEDAMRKLRVALKLAPVVSAIFANSPFAEGRIHGSKSERVAVWTDTDPHRTGLIPGVLHEGSELRDYIEWALDVPMYMFKRGDEVIANTGQPFRSFWQDGYQQHRPTLADWEQHLNTLFPEARLKGTLEVRSTDSLSRELLCAVPAFWAGIAYDTKALAAVEQLCADWSHEELDPLRVSVARRGLAATFRSKPVQHWAEKLLDIASGGLSRRARVNAGGEDERKFLQPIVDLVVQGRSPADLLLDGLEADDPNLRERILERARA